MIIKRELSDEQWFQIKELFPPYRTGRPPKDHRLMVEAILWIARAGAPVKSVNLLKMKELLTPFFKV